MLLRSKSVRRFAEGVNYPGPKCSALTSLRTLQPWAFRTLTKGVPSEVAPNHDVENFRVNPQIKNNNYDFLNIQRFDEALVEQIHTTIVHFVI